MVVAVTVSPGAGCETWVTVLAGVEGVWLEEWLEVAVAADGYVADRC